MIIKHVEGAPSIKMVLGYLPQYVAKMIEKPNVRDNVLVLDQRRSLYLAAVKPAAGLTAALSSTQANGRVAFDFEDIERFIPIGTPDHDRSFRDLLCIAVEEARKLEALAVNRARVMEAEPTPTTCED